MSEYIIDETGHKGGEEEMLTLAQENEALRKRVQELESAAWVVVSEFEDIKHGDTVHVGSLVYIEKLRAKLEASDDPK